MIPGNKIEKIDTMLDTMETTARTYEYIASMKTATDTFPGNTFMTQLAELIEMTDETAKGYNAAIKALGNIPVRLGFDSDEEIPAEIIGLTKFFNGSWHCKYQINGEVIDEELTASSERLRTAFWATIIPDTHET